MKPASPIYPLVIFAVSAGAAWWIMGWLEKSDNALVVPSVSPAVAAGKAVEPPALPRPGSSSGEMLTFISALGGASAAECQTAFSSTREVALREAIILRWAALDPAGCWQSMQAVQKQDPTYGPYAMSYVPLLFQQWIRVDYDSAVAALTGSEHPELHSFATGSMMGLAASMGGDTWQKVLQDPRLQGMEILSGPTSIVRQPPGAGVRMLAAVAACREAGRPDLAVIISERAVPPTTANQMEETISTLLTLPPGVRHQASASIVSGLVRENLPEARRVVEALPPGESRLASWSLVRAWAKEDPAAAWDWLQSNLPTGKREATGLWASTTDPVAGARILENAAPSATRDSAAGVMATNWLHRDPGAMASWVQNLEDPEMKRSVYNKIAVDWADREPEAAIAALTAPGAPPLSAGIYQNVTGKLEKISPEKAQAFIQALPPNRAALAQRGLLRK